MCEATEKAKVKDDLRVRQLQMMLRKKDSLIVELTYRIDCWNKTRCPQCHAKMKGCGPNVLSKKEIEYYEDLSLVDERSELAAPGKGTGITDSSGAANEGDPHEQEHSSDSSELIFPLEP